MSHVNDEEYINWQPKDAFKDLVRRVGRLENDPEGKRVMAIATENQQLFWSAFHFRKALQRIVKKCSGCEEIAKHALELDHDK